MSRNGDVNLPPKSCQLKSKVYKNNRQSIPQLNGEIIRVTDETEPQLCQNVIEHVNKKVGIYEVARCGRLSYVFRISLP